MNKEQLSKETLSLIKKVSALNHMIISRNYNKKDFEAALKNVKIALKKAEDQREKLKLRHYPPQDDSDLLIIYDIDEALKYQSPKGHKYFINYKTFEGYYLKTFRTKAKANKFIRNIKRRILKNGI